MESMSSAKMTAEEEKDLEKELEELLIEEVRTGSLGTEDQPWNNRKQKAAEETTTSWPQPPSHAPPRHVKVPQSFNKEDARSLQPSATSPPARTATTTG